MTKEADSAAATATATAAATATAKDKKSTRKDYRKMTPEEQEEKLLLSACNREYLLCEVSRITKDEEVRELHHKIVDSLDRICSGYDAKVACLATQLCADAYLSMCWDFTEENQKGKKSNEVQVCTTRSEERR